MWQIAYVYLIAQLSDLHIGADLPGNDERFSLAINEVNGMTRQPDLVLLTGDLTSSGSELEWTELLRRLEPLKAPWLGIPGNHDRSISQLAGHRSVQCGPVHVVLIDSSGAVFEDVDASWMNDVLTSNGSPTVIAIHHPPFETGIWWMDCIGLSGADLFEEVVRSHHQVQLVVCGHLHRPINTTWGGCSVWVGPSTSETIAVDLAPHHEPAHSAEPPSFSLHALLATTVVTHVIPAGPSARRTALPPSSAGFVSYVRGVQRTRTSEFR
jgi:3',5'-cyclic-AMP phosphodiesterase